MALIAIVDDSRLARAFVAAALNRAGYEVAEVDPTSLDEVLEKLRDLKPEVLVLDEQMPNFLGSNLVRACFEDDALSPLKVVMLTAQHDRDLERRMGKLGVHASLHKPITPQVLSSCIERLLAG